MPNVSGIEPCGGAWKNHAEAHLKLRHPGLCAHGLSYDEHATRFRLSLCFFSIISGGKPDALPYGVARRRRLHEDVRADLVSGLRAISAQLREYTRPPIIDGNP